ncbi:succinylglutamate desuccinylase/aspartoacylase family protein [Tamlana sp. 2_MG-2023]|uniref:succinylglutamate desuccinylase/aspartoacylase domain-containing protein n=1 Tax=unclassified Tamlana TaxID=2614803 RepID=UPI0026E35FA3|nr:MULTISPECIES: succinylglutamate desuccinylase/aspartoacylase family protein [unclassified Tamlana]MDO6760208.1 succinylglutamate desuccinylase/aspartoacylase family protein [Tamlana sp. 2_MG-2023]MDO6790094.1 succinylglutamate desuccinylase/aspartoacylase family protein [Tamlana sp. 1_MG-2023]
MKKERIVGKYTSGNEGPLLIVTAAVHGNEPSGVQALEAVFKTLNREQPTIKGTFVGIIGNLKALNEKVRYINEDLNRAWTINKLTFEDLQSHEISEMFEVVKILEQLQEQSWTQKYFIDCHTTSSASLPFMSVQDIGGNLSWAEQFPINKILGFSDMVKGTFDGYMTARGITGFVVEAGQHESLKSNIYHEGMIWLGLEKACRLNFEDLHEKPEAVTETLNVTQNQKTFKIITRFGLKPDDDFKMVPGFENFQPIKQSELLAIVNGKEVRSTCDAYIFMPLYQSKGNDGFFVIDSIKIV